MNIVTVEILPPEASMSGKNSCYLNCKSQGRRPSYGVCLFTLRAIDNNTIKGFDDCVSAYRNGACDAAAFRKQEQEAGRALFYQPREYKEPVARPMAAEKASRPSPFSERTIGKKVESIRETEPVVQKSKSRAKAKSPEPTFKAPNFSDAVDLAVKENKAKPEPKASAASEPVKSVIVPGMTLLQIARAMAAAKAGVA